MKPIDASAPRLLFLLAVSLGACHHGSGQRSAGPVDGSYGPISGYVLGDTAAFAPRLLDVDQKQRKVTFEVNAPAHVLLVSVIPGESAVPVGALPDQTLAEAGTHTVPVIAGQTVATPNLTWGSVDQQDYEQCVSRGQRRIPKRQVVRTDSTGKVIERTDEPYDPREEVDVERGCEAGVNKRAHARTQAASAPNRYLVLMASNMPMMLADVIKRFEEMRNIPNDVPSVVTAVAAELYGDRKGIWSAYYVRW
jgi:hypothetical protein